jgi:hypothetical protein
LGFEENLTTDFAAGHDGSGIWESLPEDGVAAELVAADNADRRVGLGDFDHAVKALGKDKVVRGNDLAVPGGGRDQIEGDVVVLDDADEARIAVKADAIVARGVAQSDLQRSVGAAVVDNDVLEVLEGLPQNTLDALGQEGLAVVDGGKDTDQRFLGRAHFVSFPGASTPS